MVITLSYNLLDGGEVLIGLGHLESVDVEMASVPEVVHPIITAIVCLTLSNLIVVMWELEVDTTGVDVEWPLLEH